MKVKYLFACLGYLFHYDEIGFSYIKKNISDSIPNKARSSFKAKSSFPIVLRSDQENQNPGLAQLQSSNGKKSHFSLSPTRIKSNDMSLHPGLNINLNPVNNADFSPMYQYKKTENTAISPLKTMQSTPFWAKITGNKNSKPNNDGFELNTIIEQIEQTSSPVVKARKEKSIVYKTMSKFGRRGTLPFNVFI